MNQQQIEKQAEEILNSADFFKGGMKAIAERINALDFFVGLEVVNRLRREAPELYAAIMEAMNA